MAASPRRVSTYQRARGLVSCKSATNRSVRHGITVQRAATAAQQARILTWRTLEAGNLPTADHKYSCFDSCTLRRPRESLCAPRDRGSQLAFGRRGRFAIQSRGIPSGSCACRKVVGGSSTGSCCSRELLGRHLARWLPGRRGHMLSGVDLLPPARGAPSGPRGLNQRA